MSKKDEALKLALEDLISEYHMENSSFAKRVDGIFREALAEQPAQQVVDSNEKAGAYMDARLWEFIDMAAAWPKASPDPRTWNHVVVYAPKPAQQEPDNSDDLTIAYMAGVQRGKELAKRPSTEDSSVVEQPAQQEPVAVHQFRSPHCSDWYDGVPDHHDGHGPYEVRTLYTSPPQRTWVGLTFGQFHNILKNHKDIGSAMGAVEKTLREQNT